MNNFIQTVIVAAVGGFVAGALLLTFGGGEAPAVVAGSPTGATFTSAKVATINWAPALVGTQSNGSATTTSLLNSDASPRIIEDVEFYCSGVGTSQTAYSGAGLAALIFTAATTSTASPAAISTTNAVLNTTVATSSAQLFVASTTPGLTGSAFVRVWAAGSYLTFASNATNTAACTIGVHYLAT